MATVGFSVPQGECNNRVGVCALHLYPASQPEREYSSDQDYRDTAGAVYRIFIFICSMHKKHIHLWC